MKTLFAEFTALPGHEDRVAELMAGLTEKVRREPGNVAFLAAYPGSAEAHAPHLLVLDADGQVLHAQSGHDLLRKGKPDRRRIEAFLEEWAPPEAPAQP